MKIDLTTGTGQDKCPINITLVSTSDDPMGSISCSGQKLIIIALFLVERKHTFSRLYNQCE
jgi:hypothetical protein